MKEYRIVIIQRQCSQEIVQFLKTIFDLRWIGFVRLCVGLVKLTQNSFTIPITKVNQKDQPKITTSLRGPTGDVAIPWSIVHPGSSTGLPRRVLPSSQ